MYKPKSGRGTSSIPQNPTLFWCWPLQILQQPLTPSTQELQEKNLQKLCCEHKMALKPHVARDQIEGGAAFRDRVEGISQLNKATFPAKIHQN